MHQPLIRVPVVLRLLQLLDRGSRWCILLCIGLWAGSGCVPVNSRIEQQVTPVAPPADSQPVTGVKVVDQPVNTTGPQAGIGNIATSVQTYMPWTLVLLLAFNTLVHNSTIRFVSSTHADAMRHAIDTMANLTQTVQQQQQHEDSA